MKNTAKFIRTLVVLGLFGVIVRLEAEPSTTSGNIPLPSGALPARTPDMSAWIVTIGTKSTDETKSQATPNPSNVAAAAPSHHTIVTKTWPIVHEVETDTAGVKWDKWYNNGTEIVAIPGTAQFIISKSGSSNRLYQDYSKMDFDRLDWLSLKTYRGMANTHGKSCFCFKGTMRTGPSGAPSLEDPEKPSNNENKEGQIPTHTFEVTAYLDPTNLFPVELDWGDELITYQFRPPPASEQSLPEEITAYLKKKELEEKRSHTPPPRPY